MDKMTVSANNQQEMDFSNNEVGTVITYHMDGATVHTLKPTDSDTIFIAGVSNGDSFINQITGKSFENIYNFLIKAVNNRTVERDYFRLYSELASGMISEEEFEKEIDENEDNYVIQNNIIPSKEDLQLALNIARDIKEVDTSEDLSSLFSFNSIEIEKLLPSIKY
ncbi:hypothetical protein [Bacteroides eggerthii]|jgi:hypothetical protein|uniref:hypothetical protein n=1 Tax=Bacteroides eggerthii TaxID=28111 RepID=UPI00189FF4D5|nr:hypothetical protein [Bacteroides eggerthii]